MIVNKDIYKMIIEHYRLKLRDYKGQLDTELKLQDKVNKKLVLFKAFINDCVINYTYEELLAFTQPIKVNGIQIRRSRNTHYYTITDLQETMQLYININKTVRELKNKLESVQRLMSALTYPAFCFIVKEANPLIVDEIIKGKEFHMGYNLASIMVIHKKRCITKRARSAIDWGKSNKLKAQLIAEGKTPFNKETAPDGEKWFIYQEGSHGNYFRWVKKNVKIENSPIYKFKPVTGTGKDSVVTKLHVYNRLNPLNYLNYLKMEPKHGNVTSVE